MLILRRKINQRTRIETPCGSFIWVTMGNGRIHVDSSGFDAVDCDNGLVKVFVGEDVLTICYKEKTIHSKSRVVLDRKGLGIDAPSNYIILREELIPV